MKHLLDDMPSADQPAPGVFTALPTASGATSNSDAALPTVASR